MNRLPQHQGSGGESIKKARIQEVSYPLSLLVGKARIPSVELWISQVDLTMSNVQVSTQYDGLVLAQLAKMPA